MDRFIDLNRAFVGAAALSTINANESRKSLRTWVVNVPEGPEAADVVGDEPIWYESEVVGWVTSGGYAHHSSQSVALGYIPAELSSFSDGWYIEVLGVMRTAVMLTEPLFDPLGERMRS